MRGGCRRLNLDVGFLIGMGLQSYAYNKLTKLVRNFGKIIFIVIAKSTQIHLQIAIFIYL